MILQHGTRQAGWLFLRIPESLEYLCNPQKSNARCHLHLFADHAIVIPIAHKPVGRVVVRHMCNAMVLRFTACNPAVAVIIPEARNTTTGPGSCRAAGAVMTGAAPPKRSSLWNRILKACAPRHRPRDGQWSAGSSNAPRQCGPQTSNG